MKGWGKLLAGAALPLMLPGCLWGPGKFTCRACAQPASTFGSIIAARS